MTQRLDDSKGTEYYLELEDVFDPFLGNEEHTAWSESVGKEDLENCHETFEDKPDNWEGNSSERNEEHDSTKGLRRAAVVRADLMRAFQNLSDPIVRGCCMPLVFMPSHKVVKHLL